MCIAPLIVLTGYLYEKKSLSERYQQHFIGVGDHLSELSDRSCLAAGLALARNLQCPLLMVCFGSCWQMIPDHLPPWCVVYPQTLIIQSQSLWMITNELRAVQDITEEWEEMPTKAFLDNRPSLQWTVESRPRAGYDDTRCRKGNKVLMTGDTLRYLLASCVN